ncbi:neuromedin U [Archangium violaceum]|uniref:neuromedin U n=1 Tax=Archangium violaceum TaxID=83451 RepID=UPI0036DC51E1
MRTHPLTAMSVSVFLLLSAGAVAQTEASPEHGAEETGKTPPEHDATELSKATQNPVGDLLSVPFQFNFNTGGGLEDRTFFLLNFQPVIPIKLSSNWNLIARTIVPVIDAPGPEGTRFRGIGDVQEQLFFAPAKSGGFIWGLGPVLSLPTATVDSVRTGSWAAGPSGVLVVMTGPWVVGGLASQLWTFEDEGGAPRINQLSFQYFINYNFSGGWALVTAPVLTANWEATRGERWTVPVGIGVSKTTVFRRQPLSLAVQYYHNVVRPDDAAANQLRFVFSLLFPTKK